MALGAAEELFWEADVATHTAYSMVIHHSAKPRELLRHRERKPNLEREKRERESYEEG